MLIDGIPTSSGLKWLALLSSQTTHINFWAKGFFPFEREQKAEFNEGLEVLLRACGRQLTHLETATNQVPTGLDNASFVIITKYCTELRVLKTCIDHVHHPTVMSLIAARCQKLEALHFLHYEAEGIDGEAAKALAWGCRELRVSNLPGTELTPEGLAAIGSGCTKLKTLVLRDCPTLRPFREAATFCSQSLEVSSEVNRLGMFLGLLKELNCKCETLKKMVLPDAAAIWRGGHFPRSLFGGKVTVWKNLVPASRQSFLVYLLTRPCCVS